SRSSPTPSRSSAAAVRAAARAGSASSSPRRRPPATKTSAARPPTTTFPSDAAARRRTRPGPAAGAKAPRRSRPHPQARLLLLQGEGRRDRLQEREPATPVHLGERQDPVAPDHGRVPPASAAGSGGDQARTRDGAPALRLG